MQGGAIFFTGKVDLLKTFSSEELLWNLDRYGRYDAPVASIFAPTHHSIWLVLI